MASSLQAEDMEIDMLRRGSVGSVGSTGKRRREEEPDDVEVTRE